MWVLVFGDYSVTPIKVSDTISAPFGMHYRA